MNYETFKPHSDLSTVVKCYWTLEVPHEATPTRQRVVPDGCIEMCFILGDDIKRFTSDKEYVIQPRAMVVGQITKPYFVQPTGYVSAFAVRFYPYGFANFTNRPISELADKDTPISSLFENDIAKKLQDEIVDAESTEQRIEIVERFLMNRLADQSTIDEIVRSTIQALSETKGSASIKSILKTNPSKRRKLERDFSKRVGMSPKLLGKVIRLQAALKMILNQDKEILTEVAYENEYYDQAHFIKDFKEFTGVSPTKYMSDDQMKLSSLIYARD